MRGGGAQLCAVPQPQGARIHSEAMRTALTEQYSAVASTWVLSEQLGRPATRSPINPAGWRSSLPGWVRRRRSAPSRWTTLAAPMPPSPCRAPGSPAGAGGAGGGGGAYLPPHAGGAAGALLQGHDHPAVQRRPALRAVFGAASAAPGVRYPAMRCSSFAALRRRR